MENSDRKTTSSLKVGILTVIALMILIFTVLWIKGRTLSAGERIEVVFHDVNGIRPGSGVQMMGLRIGQIEEITPDEWDLKMLDDINSNPDCREFISQEELLKELGLMSTLAES